MCTLCRYSLVFNANKMQVIKFSHPSTATHDSSIGFIFLGQWLHLCKSVVHLGHTLNQDLTDRDDITTIRKVMCWQANCMLHIFSSCDAHTKTKLFQSFCLSLYGSALWKVSSPELHPLAVTFNNILRKIWSLPQQCHTAILHLVGNVQITFKRHSC